jgi:ABC-2 type transport system ATP-binding protein
MYHLEIRNLRKSFGAPGKKVDAVKSVSFGIRPGICFGLLGPNGAGKTTTLEMIEGILESDGGEILFQGVPIHNNFKEYRKHIGIQFQSTSLPDFLTVREVLQLFKEFYAKTVAIEKLVQWCSLEEYLDRDSHKLSGGQLQRLLLALGLVNDPNLVFLDEPTTGLDPQARRNFWELIRQIKAQGKTIVLTTHYMEEAYMLCDEIVIMDHGSVIAQGTPTALLKQHYNSLAIHLPKKDVTLPWSEIPGKVFSSGAHHSGGEEEIEIQTDQIDATLRKLIEAGIPLSGLRVRQRDLEDLFLDLTGKGLRS